MNGAVRSTVGSDEDGSRWWEEMKWGGFRLHPKAVVGSHMFSASGMLSCTQSRTSNTVVYPHATKKCLRLYSLLITLAKSKP
jgi:hypothetical protein